MLAICCLSLFIVGLDSTIVNIALPAIGRDLHASLSGLQWTIDAYTLVLASLLILAGSTADRVGRRRTFQTGLVVFILGSLLCSLAPSLGWLIAFRMLQAVGGSMLNPVAMSIITNTFTEPRERARAIGVWGGVVGISLALGPVVGGALVGSLGWRSIFWMNIPVGVAAVVLAALLMLSGSTADRIGRRRVFQTGLVLFTAGSALCSLAPTLGWLVVFRMVQAVGGSMLNPVAMSIITNTFTDPKERARAIGVWGGVVGISMAAGPIIGGALVEYASWRAIFWINVPVGLAALLLTAR
ncbi:MAG: hypothetical protein QOE03_2469, partial [Micromonosporaceae bacterium]|nr:hypothetical protein [Micromonosporaceae bacterium]